MRLCAVCGNTDKIVIKEMKMSMREDSPLPKLYNIVTCNRCGFCYADSSATEADYEEYYAACNEYAYCPRGTVTKDMIFEEMIEILSKHVSKTAKIINIGVGRGKLEELVCGGGINMCLELIRQKTVCMN